MPMENPQASTSSLNAEVMAAVAANVEERLEAREVDNDGDEGICPTCKGTGKVKGAEQTCPTCDGTGVADVSADNDAELGGPQENAADTGLEKRRRVAQMLDGTVERREFAATDVEVRETSDGGIRFRGWASTTETPYEVADFTETIARGAFKRTLGEDPDVVLLVNHEGLPLARTKSGTLTLSEDTRGLRVDADLEPSDPDVQALLPKMRRGDLTEMSFAFRATDQEWDEDYTRRTIKGVTIHKGDVSMVTHGANSATSGTVTFRSEELGLEIRMAEGRDGKKHSKATLGEIDAAISHLNKLKAEAEPDPPPEPEPDRAERLGVTVIPSGVDAARAARARAIGGQA